MRWWEWVLIGLGLASVLAAIAIAFRSQLMFAVKFARTLMTDERIPRPLRWLIGVSMAIKVVPFPDFGIDEVVLVIVGFVLVTFYRPAVREILNETRTAEATRARLPDERTTRHSQDSARQANSSSPNAG